VWLLAFAWLAGSALAAAVPERIVAAIDAGQFESAGLMIDSALAAAGLSDDDKGALAFQRERMRRILADFRLTADDLKAQLRRQIPDLADAEFEGWDERGYFEKQLIDGRTLYFNRAASNLFRLNAEARARRREQTPFSDSPLETLGAHHRQVAALATQQERQGVLPHRVRITQTLNVDADAVPAGETVRAWIPYPRAIPGQQDDIRYLASEPATHDIAPEDTEQRTVYFEKPAVAGEPTQFSVNYELTIFARYQPVDPGKVEPLRITPQLAPYLAERPPHIVFSADMELFSKQVVAGETNPWRIAQKLYAAVDEIPWAGAREYSTIANIGDYALHAGHADCGQQTLLLMTLMRMNGIPTRWQSGMMFSPGEYWNLHDWGQMYIEPYGWMPMDVTFGRFAADSGLEWFYLGGIDGYRIAFNDDFGTAFEPAKAHFRSETVDSQRGEAEWRGGNLYFDQWDYSFHAEVLPGSPAD